MMTTLFVSTGPDFYRVPRSTKSGQSTTSKHWIFTVGMSQIVTGMPLFDSIQSLGYVGHCMDTVWLCCNSGHGMHRATANKGPKTPPSRPEGPWLDGPFADLPTSNIFKLLFPRRCLKMHQNSFVSYSNFLVSSSSQSSVESYQIGLQCSLHSFT